MSQISNNNLKAICDKMTRHAAEANGSPMADDIATGAPYTETAPNAGLLVANTDVLGALKTLVTGFTDADQQADFIEPVLTLFQGTPLINQFIYSFWQGVRRALDAHVSRYSGNAMAVGDRSPLDAALRVINLSTLVRLSGAFNQYYGDISPANLFAPTPFTLAQIIITGATALTFTHVSAIDGIYGPGQIAIRNTKTEGLTSTVLTLTGIAGGLALSPEATVATTTDDQLTACDDTAQVYTDCTAATVTGGFTGDTFDVVILPDRSVAAA